MDPKSGVLVLTAAPGDTSGRACSAADTFAPAMTSAGGKTIVFFPEPGAWGPTNNCVALGDVLRERGHRVVFVVDESFSGVLAARGFEEREMRMAPVDEASDPTADPWAEFIRVTAPATSASQIGFVTVSCCSIVGF